MGALDKNGPKPDSDDEKAQRARDYRDLAATLRDLAGHAAYAETKDALLRLAISYERLAETLEHPHTS